MPYLLIHEFSLKNYLFLELPELRRLANELRLNLMKYFSLFESKAKGGGGTKQALTTI